MVRTIQNKEANVSPSCLYPDKLTNWIDGKEYAANDNTWVKKINPATGSVLCKLAGSKEKDVNRAVLSCMHSRQMWADTPGVRRGLILLELVLAMKSNREKLAQIVAEETGRPVSHAFGEVDAAIQCGLFFASEGQRLYGKTCTSGAENKHALTIRQPRGVAGLIIAANTPIANAAWKVFPALVCGNTAILKAAEDTPATAWFFGKIAKEAGLPDGVLNIIQGLGAEAGDSLVRHENVDVISFTGSSRVGKLVQNIAGNRLARVSLELGGKNAFVVCDDSDLEAAANWASLSIFSNAGQRCAAASRLFIFRNVYKEFKKLLLKKAENQKVGIADGDDYGAVINERQLSKMIQSVKEAVEEGATLLTGGGRFTDAVRKNGFFMKPTLLENVSNDSEIARTELFGPIGILTPVEDLEEALLLANQSPYGLTAAIHTRNLDLAIHFCQRVETGVAVINAGTYGSEPHMPFGGRKLSGNGTREPGTEALDVYSELKDIYINVSPQTN